MSNKTSHRARLAALVVARDGVGIAVEGLRANRVRATLTILGVVIGVATVVLMAAIIGGVRTAVLQDLEEVGPENFVLERFDMTSLQLSQLGERRPWDSAPRITLAEAELVGALEGVRSATPSVTAAAEAKSGAAVVGETDIEGLGADWPVYRRGDFRSGRNFLPGDVARSASVVVISSNLADALFGRADPIGATVHLSGRPFEVVGVFQEKMSLFADSESGWAVVPYSTAIRYLSADVDWMTVQVVPKPGVPQEEVMDQATAALRASRGLRPTQENNFALTRQDAFRDLYDRTTGAFVLVLLVLSSVGLVVGGVGVMAIMTISVTERTREIGIRKALGATRGAILWQFLVESATLTTIGGALGLGMAAAGVLLLDLATPVPAAMPPWAVAAALVVVAVSGVGFGMYPAGRAARLSPVEALRHE